MQHDGLLDLAFGASAETKTWKNKKVSWKDLTDRLAKPVVTSEKYAEYMAASKEDQGRIKDVGGYVGGYIRTGRRTPANILHRQLLTLDLDFATTSFWLDFVMQYDCAAVVHTTHKHSDATPRYRLIVPLSREVTSDEYQAITRQVAGALNIELFDRTTFQPSRLMFWPSVSKDAEYGYELQDGAWLDADEVLATYVDWTDVSSWPMHADSKEEKHGASKQEDPARKPGIVGAFCRTFSISEAVAEFLPDVYTPAGEDRYTFVGGTTSAGVVVYEDKFTYSWHSTDPTGSQLCNAFDLVRIHLFGHLDSGQTSGKDTKSFQAMTDMCVENAKVKTTIALERRQAIAYDFADQPGEEGNTEWLETLTINKKGEYLSSAHNIGTILTEDPALKGIFKYNAFDEKRYIVKHAPWRRVDNSQPVKNVDYAGLRNYLEVVYGITGVLKIDDALALVFDKHTFHPVREYLEGLTWDGLHRIDTLLHDVFHVPNNEYHTQVMRKVLTGGVARIMHPGCKFDLVLTLVSPMQGTGKSSFFRALGCSWFSDSFTTVQGKEALEQLQGAWVIEMAELSGLRRAEVETVKHFISKQTDMYRPAYARTSESFERQCFFVATTNEYEFLKDATGNRRFLPIDIPNRKLSENLELSAFLADDYVIGQVWAEAMHLYKQGETTYMDLGNELLAEEQQRKHSSSDERVGIILEYLNVPLPENWAGLDLHERRLYLENPAETGARRDTVCVAELWAECFERPLRDMDRYKTRELNDIMRHLRGWAFVNSTRTFHPYGVQKYYKRVTI